jgi:TonB family protein
MQKGLEGIRRVKKEKKAKKEGKKMIKAKEVSVKNVLVFLAFSLAVSAGYFIARPHVVTSKSIPVFIGEEVVVHKAVRVAYVKASATKAETVPMPTPKVAAPLPIVPPSITYKVLPVYPTTALEKGLGGMVLLSVYVGLTGQPERIETRTSSGIKELDDSAAKAVSQWRFSPAAQGGTALASWFEVPVRFQIN